MVVAQKKRPRFSARVRPSDLTRSVLNWSPMLVLLIFVVVSAWLLRALDTSDAGVGARVTSPRPDFYMERFETTVMDARGEPRRRLSAERMDHFPESDTKEFTKPHLILFREGAEPWHATSARGWASPDDDVIVLLGEVHIWRNFPGGERELDIETQDLRVLTESELGETDQPVVIRTPKTETHGTGMRAYLAESRLEIDSRVRTIVQPGAYVER